MLTLLAQAVPSLPEPPLVRRLLLEDPNMITAALVVAAIAGFYFLNRKSRPREAFFWCFSVLLAAAGLQGLARGVETEREVLLRVTTRLVSVTSKADAASLSSMLSSDCRLSNDFNLADHRIPFDADKQQILGAVRSFLKDQYPLKECAILETQAVVDGDAAGRTQVRIRAVPEALGAPIISWWRMDWKRGSSGEWLVRGIQPMDLGLAGGSRPF